MVPSLYVLSVGTNSPEVLPLRTNDLATSTRAFLTINDVIGPSELQDNPHWKMAVWAIRAGFVCLAVAAAGLIVMFMGSTPWVLACGVILWLVAEVVTSTGFLWTRSQLPEPRPGYWSMRYMLIYDSVHSWRTGRRA